ncbi:hypothetical protein BATDEDRAFT_22639 [Batrachochytrium dendrobatidis JAM81]|uniref:Uncharacterized protein n=2 Tax=Batrachochytrium dendrobatidis TaxID=109871 RepID=F4NX45_BATDJ|nr:uncharacterized protein BATDEDRAFT_22639 [Batrachochytrium dendrobatidis JAM81]EGF82611.1 hypothetical protein BATDEDRAFT_22639 [Batrachochytrium dendrobatidis JAM81]KAJ8328509.1 cytochrome oxidase assembly protein 1 [Batrachochytrium dendrobatidis]KAK5666927.1 cytochrome oxidase assembly protein 1 [Batrachochytrium dendrobatidis]OAJ40043.1 hypothetical protein BDEG_23822 [Batrachochytrium dendrobatidis JEL423]|eukprot:XP_006676589.1 hypothetical protein BATDEDRAFT_22639 [Batrachochytrium dendrobatidis JAM81]
MAFRTPGFIVRVINRPAVYVGLGAAGLSFWAYTIINATNSNKSHNSIFKGVMFHLRHDPRALALLGDDIFYDQELHKPVQGTFNVIRGVADYSFTLQGSQAVGNVRFKGHHIPASGCWNSVIFELDCNGETIQL